LGAVSRGFGIVMARTLCLVLLLLFSLVAGIFATEKNEKNDEDEDLRATYGLDVNNYYEDETDEAVDGDEGVLQPASGFDFVVEEGDEEEEVEEEPDRMSFTQANFLQSSFLFTTHSGVMYLGEENEILIGLGNDLDKPINISAIRLSLLHPMEPTYYYLQNCTVQTYFQILNPKTFQSFLYRFTTDALLQPRDYVVVVNVYFEIPHEQKRYVYQPVNLTHDFIDAPTKLDTETLFIALSLVTAVGFILYLLFTFLFGGKKSRRGQSDRGVPITRTEVQEEWISHLQQPKKKAPKRQ